MLLVFTAGSAFGTDIIKKTNHLTVKNYHPFWGNNLYFNKAIKSA